MLLTGLGLLAAIALGTLIASLWPNQDPKMPGASSAASDSMAQREAGPAEEVNQRAVEDQSSRGSSSTSAPGQSAEPAASLAAPTPETRQLVDSLVNLQSDNGVLSQEQVAGWKENLQKLIQQGSVGVPAIREFLAKNTEIDFGPGGKEMFGYASARNAMFDALTQIGGAEAIAAFSDTLQTSADPREVAMLAQALEKLDPEQHRQEALEAARQTLAMAAEEKLPGRDVAPLFEVFEKYGDATTVQELTKSASQWGYYSAVALAQLPEGAGITSLIDMAQGSSSARLNALEMLAQVSTQYPEARTALLDITSSNKILPSDWPYLTRLLAGDEYHFQSSVLDASAASGEANSQYTGHVLFGNQHFYTAPPIGGMTQERITQQSDLIDQLLKATIDTAALQALQQSRDLLFGRASQAVVASRP
jgi:hypothetical protein